MIVGGGVLWFAALVGLIVAAAAAYSAFVTVRPDRGRGVHGARALSAHVDIERALARELRESAREYCHHLETVDTLAIERVERPVAPES